MSATTTAMCSIDRRDRLERTASMANNKGLLNKPGENNCFLNSAVQVLWHLDIFRRSFRELTGHFCMGKSCIFCALDFIFRQFQDSNNDALPPDALRLAMAVTFKDQQKFQLGDMDDAAECFENILSRLHFHLASEKHDDGCNAKHCISHQKFAMQLIEQTMCRCGESSEPLPFFQLVHYVSTSTLCARAQSHPSSFGTLLRRAGEDVRRCPGSECGEKVRVQHLLLNCPDIVSIGLIWDSESPDIEHIADVLECIGTRIRLQDVFHRVCDERAATVTLNLVGIVTYYGKHYSTFFLHSKLRTWIYFDDARVKEIGPDWPVVIDKCLQCHYQPLLLLYANPHGTPVNCDTAPKQRIQIDSARPMRVSVENWKRNTLERIHGLRDQERSGGGTPLSTNRSEAEVVTSKPPKPFARRSRSVDDLDSSDPAPKPLSRAPSVGSDLTNSPGKGSVSSVDSPGKEKRKHKLKRIGSAIMHAMQPAMAVSKPGAKNSLVSKKKGAKKSRRSSTGSSCSSGDQDLIDFGTSKHEQATREIMRLYDESKAISARSRINGHDSGISSAPSSATESVSSTDTMHGGSDEDLMTFKQNTVQRRPTPDANTLKGSSSANQAKLEAFLHDAEQKVFMSQNAENYQDYAAALGFCTDAATRFRTVAELPEVSDNTKNYANMKRIACLTRARALRERVQAQPPGRGAADTTASLSKRDEETLTRQKPQLIIPPPQPNRPPPYGTLPRKIHTAKEPFGSTLQAQKTTEQPTANDLNKQDRRFFLSQPENQFSSLPAGKSKRAGAVHTSGHYVSKAGLHQHVDGAQCGQQIKPDAWCYSPVHYDDVSSRMQSLAVQPSSLRGPLRADKRASWNHDPRMGLIPERREEPIPEYRSVPSAQHRKLPASEQFGSNSERREEPIPEYRGVTSAQPRRPPASEQFGSNTERREEPIPEYRSVPSTQNRTRVYAVEDGGATTGSRAPTYARGVPSRAVYVSATRDSRRVSGYESSPEFSSGYSTRRQPKVIYAGKCPVSTTRSPNLQSARSTESLDNTDQAHGTYPQRSAAAQARQPHGQRPAPAYVAAPSYNHTQYLKSQSASAIIPRQSTSLSNSPMGSPSNSRLPSTNIPDRLLCERCRRIPIRRTQRICGACESEMEERHRTSTAGLY